MGLAGGLRSRSPRETDLVIGADGLHSRVRQLVFGLDAGGEVSLGYHAAAFEVEGIARAMNSSMSATGFRAGRFFASPCARIRLSFSSFFVTSTCPPKVPRTIRNANRPLITSLQMSVGSARISSRPWPNVGGLYFDRVSQIRLGRWKKGCTALIGDAAACVSLLAGQGSLLAMAEVMSWRASCTLAAAITPPPLRVTNNG